MSFGFKIVSLTFILVMIITKHPIQIKKLSVLDFVRQLHLLKIIYVMLLLKCGPLPMRSKTN